MCDLRVWEYVGCRPVSYFAITVILDLCLWPYCRSLSHLQSSLVCECLLIGAVMPISCFYIYTSSHLAWCLGQGCGGLPLPLLGAGSWVVCYVCPSWGLRFGRVFFPPPLFVASFLLHILSLHLQYFSVSAQVKGV